MALWTPTSSVGLSHRQPLWTVLSGWSLTSQGFWFQDPGGPEGTRCCRVAPLKRHQSGGNKTKQKFLVCACGTLRCAWHRTLGGLLHGVASQWAAGGGILGRGRPRRGGGGQTCARLRVCLPVAGTASTGLFFPLAAFSLPAVSQVGFYFYLGVPFSASARTVQGCSRAAVRYCSCGS